jgi:uncharacterized protein
LSAGAGPLTVQHDRVAGRFETRVEGLRCVCDYRLHDGVVHFTHTEVPTALGGRGIAADLVAAALLWARAEGLKVRPLCSYVSTYLRRHPEQQDLVA